MGRNMRTAFETISTRLINGKRIVTHFSKGNARGELIKAHLFLEQALMRGLDMLEAIEETEIAYPSIEVKSIELDPVRIALNTKLENWTLWFEYIEEST